MTKIILTTLLMITVASFGQTPPAAQPKSGKQKRTSVDFEDQLIQGELKKPELFYLLQKKQFNFGKLIKLRENFIPEMSKTAEDLNRAK